MIGLVVLASKGALDSLPPGLGEFIIPGVIAGACFVYMLYMILKLTGKIDF